MVTHDLYDLPSNKYMEENYDTSDDWESQADGVAAPLCQKTRDRWTRRDFMLLTLNILVKFGDSVEIYLPGVITQLVSCQMGLTDLQEGFLAITLFVTMGTTIFVTAYLTDRSVQVFLYLRTVRKTLIRFLKATIPHDHDIDHVIN